MAAITVPPGRRRGAGRRCCCGCCGWPREAGPLLAPEHGVTVADACGDIQRGREVEFAVGIPHLLKGESTEGGGGIDVNSRPQHPL